MSSELFGVSVIFLMVFFSWAVGRGEGGIVLQGLGRKRSEKVGASLGNGLQGGRIWGLGSLE